MKKKFELRINQKIEILPDKDAPWQSSLVQDLTDQHLFVAVPVNKKVPVIPRVNDHVLCSVTEKNGIYLFETTFLGIKKGDRIPLLTLTRPHVFTRRQRRDYFRIPAVLGLKIRIGAENNERAVRWRWVTPLDIGGGGLKMSAPFKLEKGSIYQFNIFLGHGSYIDLNPISVFGQIVRAEGAGYPDKENIYGVRFVEMEETQRDRVISYIFSLSTERSF